MPLPEIADLGLRVPHDRHCQTKPGDGHLERVTVALALEQHDLIRKNRSLQLENAKKSKEISARAKLTVSNRSQLGFMLHKKNLLTATQLQELHRIQHNRKEPFICLLLEKDWIAERDIRKLLRQELMFEEVALAEFQVDAAMNELIPRSFCERQLMVPLRLEGCKLMLAVADPMDNGLIDDMRFTSGLDVQVVMADVASIRHKIAALCGEGGGDFKDLETMVGSTDPYEGIEIVIEAMRLGAPTPWRGEDCPVCSGRGYRGRVGIYEVLVPDDEFRDLIGRGAGMLELTRAVQAKGLIGLLGDARAKVVAGLTTLEEVLRVLGPAN